MDDHGSAAARRILLVSRLFSGPDSVASRLALRQAVRLRNAGYDLDIIAPVPRASRILSLCPVLFRSPRRCVRGNIGEFEVHQPTYYRPPGDEFVAREADAMWWGIRATCERLAADKRFDLVMAWDFSAEVGAGCAAARQLGVPCVGLAIGADLNVYTRRRPKALRFITRNLMACDAIFCVSEKLCRRVTNLTRGRRHSTCIPWPVDTALFCRPEPEQRAVHRRELGWPNDAVVVLSVGTIAQTAGSWALVEAFDQIAGDHPAAMLVHVGDGLTLAAVERRVARSPFADRIRLVRAGGPDDWLSYFRAADVLVSCPGDEVTPAIAAEGLAMGLPIVTDRLPDDRVGLAATAHDAGALRAALNRLLGDDVTRQSMGEEARRWALDYLDESRLEGLTRTFLDQLVAQGRRKPDPAVRNLAVMADITSNSPPYTEGLARGLNPHLEVTSRACTWSREPCWYDQSGLREDLMSWVMRLFLRRPNLNEQGPVRDMIRTAGYLTSWGQLVWEAWRSGTKVIHIQWCKVPVLDCAMFALLRLTGFKIVYTVHNALPHNDRRWRSKFTYRRLYRLAHALVVLSDQVGSDIQDWVLPGIADKIHQIDHGLLYPKTPSPTRCVARRDLAVDDAKEIVLFFGGISAYKGVGDLIEALAVASKTRRELVLYIAGRPSEPFEPYRRMIDELRIADRVRAWPEFVHEALKVTLYAAADVVTLPHRDPSQSGAGLESLALGKPLIATNRGGLPDLVQHARTGYIVPAEDPQAMAKAIDAFFSQSRQQQQEMADASRQLGLDRFDWTVIADKHVELYRSLAGR